MEDSINNRLVNIYKIKNNIIFNNLILNFYKIKENSFLHISTLF